MTSNVYVFLLVTAAVTLTGVMMPGPALAGAIAKGYEDRRAGLLIALGHGLVELPVIAVIVLGFATLLTRGPVALFVGVVGGLVLASMGITMIRRRKDTKEPDYLPYPPLVVGVLTTGLNPGFYVWWATVGAMLVMAGVGFGPLAVAVFVLLHLSCDIGYYSLITSTVHRTRHLWSERTRAVVFGSCGALMLGFGAWFVASAVC